MGVSLKEVLQGIGLETTDEIEAATGEKHVSSDNRIKAVSRPTTEVVLGSLAIENVEYARQSKDPTPELVFLPKGVGKDGKVFLPYMPSGYMVFCKDTEETWYAPTLECLNANFIYREDLHIEEIRSVEHAEDLWSEFNKDLLPGFIT